MARLRAWVARQRPESWITFVLVAGSSLFVIAQLHPLKHVLADTTPAGGDMGAHVWGPAFLRDELLPRLRWSGWTPDWYAGFPAYHFYMVLPSLAIVALDVVLPYNVAFKLIAVAGLAALPVCAWAMGRLARLAFPIPGLLAVATVPFLFERSFHIYGGNVASTLAGEFAFTISLCFALLFVGVVLRGLDTGGMRAWAAVLLGLTVLCHLIPAVFAVVAAVVALLFKIDWRGSQVGNRLRLWWLAGVGVVGSLLSAFWAVPFLLQRSYLNDMGWEKVVAYWESIIPGPIGNSITRMLGGDATATVGPGDVGDMTVVFVLAVVGAGTALAFRRRFGLFVLAVGFLLVVAFRLAPEGRLWNARLLPFWYLCLYFLAALAVAELIAAIGVLLARSPEQPTRSVNLAGPLVAALVVAAWVAFPLRTLPFGDLNDTATRYSWMGISSSDSSFVRSWAKWNFTGYERKDAYPEYREIVDVMASIGDRQGCGRAMWEYEAELDRFGTPMALMLLPYWTDGCIGSMEGLYFESSATTPYHFLNQSELSAKPSRPQRDLPYGELDIDLGVQHLQLLGVRYYLAFSDTAVQQANLNPDLTLLSTTGKWHIYEVADSELLQPLEREPVVVRGVDGHESWQRAAVDWYLDPNRWDVFEAADGPDEWTRADPGSDGLSTERYPTAQAEVTKLGTDRIEFRVDRTGVPILVKTSYFPNWQASGAEGPYRVTPNLMVVIPTDEHVTLTYGRTGIDWLGIVLTLAGIALVVVFVRRGALTFPEPEAPEDEPVDDEVDDVVSEPVPT